MGFARAARRLAAPGAVARGDALVVLQAASLVGGAFVIPTPQLQYFLMALPLLALLAAEALVAATRAVSVGSPERRAVMRAVLLAAAVAAMTAPPLADLARRMHPDQPKAAAQLGRMRAVLDSTTPDQTVLDGFTGAGVFRPHAWYYFFVHEEIRPLLGPPEIGRLRAALRDGEIAPAIVLFDDDVQHLPAEITSFLRDNYAPTPDPLVWRPKDFGLGLAGGRIDVGGGPTDVLVGRGWSEPEREGEMTLRRTQGRRSTLRVPLRAPADLVVEVRARSESAPWPRAGPITASPSPPAPGTAASTACA